MIDEIDLDKVESVVLRRLIEEVRHEQTPPDQVRGYNRSYNRHMRSGYNRAYNRHNR